MIKCKVIYVQEIIFKSYYSYSVGKKGIGRSLKLRLFQLKGYRIKYNNFDKKIIGFKKDMGIHIKKCMEEYIDDDTEGVLLFKKSSKKSSTEIGIEEWMLDFYRFLYSKVYEIIISKIGNELHLNKIFFKNKAELEEAVYSNQKIKPEDMPKVINLIWGKSKNF